MSTFRNVLFAACPCLLLAVAAPPTWAADKDSPRPPAVDGPRRPGPEADPARRGQMNPFLSQYDQMERTLELSDDQKGKLKPMIETMNKELEDLRQDSLARIRETMPDPNAGGGVAPGKGRQQMFEEIRKANEEMAKLLNASQAKINEVLTPEQRVTWETYKLNRSLMGRFNQIDLTDDQKQQIKPLVDAAGKEMAEAKDAAAANAIAGKLLKKIMSDILTEEQIGKFILSPGTVFNMQNIGMPPNASPDRNKGIP